MASSTRRLSRRACHPEIIDAFTPELHGRVGSVTRASYISKIQRIARILAPERDLAWLREIEGDLRYEARPRPKYHRIVPSQRLLALGLELIRRGETSNHLTDLARARLVRDGLMIALLALCPIRLRNLAELRVGRQLRRVGETWWIILEAPRRKPDVLMNGRYPRFSPRLSIVGLSIGARCSVSPTMRSGRPSRVVRWPTPTWATSSPKRRAENLASRSTLISFATAPSTPWRSTLATAWGSLQGFSSTPTHARPRSTTTKEPRLVRFAGTNKSLIS